MISWPLLFLAVIVVVLVTGAVLTTWMAFDFVRSLPPSDFEVHAQPAALGLAFGLGARHDRHRPPSAQAALGATP